MFSLKNIFSISLISLAVFLALLIILFFAVFNFSIIDNRLIDKIASIESQIQLLRDEELKKTQIEKVKMIILLKNQLYMVLKMKILSKF